MALGAEPHVEENWAIESGLFTLDGAGLGAVFDSVDLDRDMVPHVAKPGTVVGAVSAAAEAASGLAAGTPLVVGGADHVLSAYAAGLAPRVTGWSSSAVPGTSWPSATRRVSTPGSTSTHTRSPGCGSPTAAWPRVAASSAGCRRCFGGPALLAARRRGHLRRDPRELLCLPYFLGEKSPHARPRPTRVVRRTAPRPRRAVTCTGRCSRRSRTASVTTWRCSSGGESTWQSPA